MEENMINISLEEKEKIVIASKKKERNKFFIISVISVIVFLIIWQLITDVFKLFDYPKHEYTKKLLQSRPMLNLD